MENLQKRGLSHRNGIDSIFHSMELQEVPESEVVSLEKHINDSACKSAEDVQNSESKLAQLMSQDCLQDFKAVIFPDDSGPNLKRKDGHQVASTATSSGTQLLESRTEIDAVSSIIEKVCQEVNGNYGSNPNEVEVEEESSGLEVAAEKRLENHQSQGAPEQQNTVPKRQKTKLQCEVCDKVLASGDYLKHHMRTHTDERPFKCTLCEKTFRQPSNLHAHMRIHTNEKPFICKICDKAFSQSGNMHIHMGIHLDQKKFQCPTCEKFFSQNGSLRNHMKIHSGERPHVCSVCSKDFVRKSHLDAHMRTHTGEKPFICSFCSRAFSQSGDLQSHMRLHTGDLPHICTECGKGYSAKSHLNKHMRIHSPERPFECSICGKSYNAKSTLVSHMRLHTGDRPYGCSWCDRRFYSSSHLKKHIKVHHRSYFINNEVQKPRMQPMVMKPFDPLATMDGSSSSSASVMNGSSFNVPTAAWQELPSDPATTIDESLDVQS